MPIKPPVPRVHWERPFTSEGLVNCYPFHDKSGLPSDAGPQPVGMSAAVNGGWDGGQRGSCYKLDGTVGAQKLCITKTTTAARNLEFRSGDGPLLVQATFRVLDLSNSPCIFGNGAYFNGGWYIQLGTSGGASFIIGGTGVGEAQYIGAGAFVVGTWHTLQMYFVDEGGVPRFSAFLDGTSRVWGLYSYYPATAAVDFVIGNYPPLSGTFAANMEISDLRVYRDRVVNVTEWAQRYHSGL